MLALWGNGLRETLGEQTGEGQTVTAANGSKGTPATIGTAGFDYSGFLLIIGSANSVGFRVDLIADSTIIFPDIGLDARAAGANASPICMWVPLAIPVGTVLKAQAQSTGANTLRTLIVGYQGDGYAPPSSGGIVNLTGWSGIDSTSTATPGTTAGTSSAWAEVIASTATDLVALYIAGNTTGDTTRTAGRLIIDIGVGAAGSEVVLFTIQTTNNNSAQGDTYGPIPCAIPAGTRIAWRVRPSYTSATPDQLGLVVHGIVG